MNQEQRIENKSDRYILYSIIYEDFSGLRPRTRKQVLNLHDDDNCNKNWRSSFKISKLYGKNNMIFLSHSERRLWNNKQKGDV